MMEAMGQHEKELFNRDEILRDPIFFHRIFGASPVGVVLVNLKGEFLQVNQETSRIFGYSKDELIGMNFMDITHEEDFEKSKELLNSLRIGKVDHFQIEKNYVRKDKSLSLCLTNVSIYRGEDNDPLFFLAKIFDLNSKMLFDREQEDCNSLFREAFNNASIGRAISTPKTESFVHVNRHFCDLLGYSQKELLKKGIIGITHPEDLAVSFRQIQSILSGEKENFELKKRLLRKDGSIVWVNVGACIQKDMEGNPRYILSQVSDITSDVIQTEELKKLSEERKAFSMGILSGIEEERKRISRDLHDDLGQLIVVMKMEIKSLEKRMPCASACMKSINELLKEIINSSRRVSDGLRPPLLDNMGLSEAMEFHLGKVLSTSGVRFEFVSSLKEVSFSTDLSLQLFRIFQEALTNIIKHAKASLVKVSLERSEEEVKLKIVDDGVGVDFSSTSKLSLGVLGMRERTSLLGGEFVIKPGENSKGTIISVSIPLQ